jgi:uncharacterized protein with HEPN domain
MPRDDLLLEEMVDASARAIEIVGRLDPDDPTSDRDLLDALLWNFTVLGEAARAVSDEVKTEHQDVPWADPVRLRNRIVHGYWSVDLDVLMSTAKEDLPALIEAVERIRAGR